MDPSEMYAPIMATVHEKIYLSKVNRPHPLFPLVM